MNTELIEQRIADCDTRIEWLLNRLARQKAHALPRSKYARELEHEQARREAFIDELNRFWERN